jgi:hypothetical protein
VVEQTTISEETVVAGDGAFDRGHAHTTLLPSAGANPLRFTRKSW